MKRLYPTTLLLAMATLLCGELSAAESLAPRKSPAKSVIYIFLAGGPAHIDTFDPKPDAGRDYYGNYKTPVETNVEGIYINHLLEDLSQIADKYSLIRSMTHNSNAHEIGQYVMYTGDMSRGPIVYPSFGSTISYMLRESYKGILPPYISVPNSSTRFNESGFLGSEYKSFNTGGSPESSFFEVEGIVSQSVTTDELKQKRQLLDALNSESRSRIEDNHEVEKFQNLQEENYNLILGESRKLFDLSNESDETRKSYGINRIGQSCLVARRLVEAGTPVVVVTSAAWDTHKEHFKRMATKLPEMDQAVAALICDLENRGMLDDTIVILGGEFGREPRVGWEPPWNGGRGHFGAAFSYLVAGGGFKGGEVLGETDARAEKVVKRPVYPGDFWGTIYYLMGIDPTTTLPHPQFGTLPIIPPLPESVEMPSEGIMLEIIKPEAL